MDVGEHLFQVFQSSSASQLPLIYIVIQFARTVSFQSSFSNNRKSCGPLRMYIVLIRLGFSQIRAESAYRCVSMRVNKNVSVIATTYKTINGGAQKCNRRYVSLQDTVIIKTFLSTEISVINRCSSNHDDLPSGKIRLTRASLLSSGQHGVIFYLSNTSVFT